MPNNFRLTANTYISKAGNNANAGTKDLPKKTIGSALVSNTTVAISSGMYQDGNISFPNAMLNYILSADGKVIIDGGGVSVFDVQTGSSTFNDLILRNFSSIKRQFTGGGNAVTANFYRCQFLFNSKTSQNFYNFNNGVLNLYDCIIKNGQLYTSYAAGGSVNISVYRTLFLNSECIQSTLSQTQIIDYCYFDSTSKVSVLSATSITNCNIQGQIKLQSEADTAYTDIESFKIAKGITSRTDLFSSDPGFNNIAAEDYTLKRSSIHLTKKIGPNQYRLGSGFYLKGSVGDVSASSGHYLENAATGEQYPVYAANNLTASLQNSQLRLKIKESVGGSFTGDFKIALKFADVPVQIKSLDFAAGLNFDTDYPATENQFNPNNPEVYNSNVPNNHNYTSGHAGRNPNRLDYDIRWSNKDAPNVTVSTDWVTGANYLIVEWGAPQYNPVTLVGNGDPLFQLSPTDTNDNPRSIIAKWVDLSIIIRNNHYSK